MSHYNWPANDPNGVPDPDNQSGPSGIPDGYYSVRVERMHFDEYEGRAIVKWELSIIAGEYAGTRLRKSNFTHTDRDLSYLKGDLKTCGIMPPAWSDLENMAPRYKGICLHAKVQTKKDKAGKDRENIYFQRLMTHDEILGSQVESDPELPPPPAGNELPF